MSEEVKPTLVTGIVSREMVAIPWEHLSEIKVDTSYQRPRREDIVAVIRNALECGGECPFPAVLVDRDNRPSEPQGRYIVDGQQRMYAHREAKKSLHAIVVRVGTHDEERKLFVVANTRASISPNLLVHAWPGPSGDMLRDANADTGHSLCGRVKFDSYSEGNLQQPIGAYSLAAGLMALLRDEKPGGKVERVMAFADGGLAGRGGAVRARFYLELVARVFHDIQPKPVLTVALAQVAKSRWKNTVEAPPEGLISALRKIEWTNERVMPEMKMQFCALAREAIEKRWPAGR
jgi:hypothetical protein